MPARRTAPFSSIVHCNRHDASASFRKDADGPASTGSSCNGDLPLATPLSRSAVATFAAPPPSASAADPLARAILDSLDDAKAEDVTPIDLRGKTSLADTMVLATGRSTTHVGAIADRVTRACKAAGVAAKVEGLPHCDWVLVDASDVIVHIFRPEVRQFYNLEKLWGVDRPSERQAAG